MIKILLSSILVIIVIFAMVAFIAVLPKALSNFIALARERREFAREAVETSKPAEHTEEASGKEA